MVSLYKNIRKDWPHSAKHAIARRGPSKPVQLLHAAGRIVHPALDYGCGLSGDWRLARCHRWDPYHVPWKLHRRSNNGTFNTILCTYVLNVISRQEADKVLRHIKRLLAPGGTAYITVRRDVPVVTFNKDNTVRQRLVHLQLPIFHQTSAFCIYEMRKKGKRNAKPAT